MNRNLNSTPERRALMRRVRQTGTAAEVSVGLSLRKLGRRYRKNVPSLPGSPDFANKSEKWAVLVHGCFWHRHDGCRRATTPTANADFWRAKFEGNVARDDRNQRMLIAAGFRVQIIWECEIAKADLLLGNFFESSGIKVR